MARYFYTARSSIGETKSGIREAKDIYELARLLRQEGYLLIRADLEEKTKKRKLKISLPFFNKISVKDRLFFTRNLKVMVAAGISLPRSLKVLAFQTKRKKFKNALLDISEEITKGNTFSLALSRYPDIFPELFQNMIKVSEEAGTLEEVLDVLTHQMEREFELKSKIKGAMLYPAVIIFAMIGIGFLMLIMVVPKLAETFRELNFELPLTTKLVISLGTFLAEKWYLVILIVVIFLILFRFFLKTKTGKYFIDTLFLKMPVISNIVKKTNSAYVTRTLSSLIAAGVPIVKSLEIIGAALSNFYFKDSMSKLAERVKKGNKLSEALEPYSNLYSDLIAHMVAVGEETGETSKILGHLADFYEEEVTNATKNLSSIVEPVLMLLIGAVVGFFAISMVQPMYSMLQGFQ